MVSRLKGTEHLRSGLSWETQKLRLRAFCILGVGC